MDKNLEAFQHAMAEAMSALHDMASDACKNDNVLAVHYYIETSRKLDRLLRTTNRWADNYSSRE